MSDALDSLHPTLRDMPGKTIVERYRVDAVLGVGGMGAVFRGKHLGLKRDVAIKVLHPDLMRDPEISKRFDREAHSASRLDHPNCLRVTDVGTTDDGVKFMVMDLLSGEELADRLGERIIATQAVPMMLQVLRGLEHAHDKGVIHRDIKPENIFITEDHDGREVLKLVDFGIAKLVGGGTNDKMTKAGLIFGTPAYMSPEQAMGMEADGRADLYAVGVILYEMLCGVPPFQSEDPVKLVRMQVSRDPPPLPDYVLPELVDVVMKLMAKDRDERYQTATEAREALEQIWYMIVPSDVISLGLPGSTTGSNAMMFVNPAASGPISVVTSLPRRADTTGSFSPSALPTLPPRPGALGKPKRKMGLVAGGAAAVVVLALAAWGLSGGGAGSGNDASSVAGSQADGDGGDGAPADGDDDGLLELIDGPDEEKLLEIDRLIMANNPTDALKVLEPLMDEYPDNAALSWRHGKILAKSKRRKNHPKALAAYGDALDADPSLLEDQEFYAELHGLLTDPKLRSEALDFALRKMGQKGHKFLLELVNDEKKPMGYADRRRALQELSTVDENDLLVNWQLHRALDLLQATQSLTPCTAYRDALESIANSPDYWYLARLLKAEMPKPKTGDNLTEEELADGAQCEGLDARRSEVVLELELLAPDEDTGGEVPKTPTKKPPSTTSTAKKKPEKCNKPFALLDKDCR